MHEFGSVSLEVLRVAGFISNGLLLGETMSSVLKAVNDLFFSAIQEAFPAVDLQNGMVQGSSGTRFGDYKCTAPMTIAQVRLIQY